MNKLTEHRDKQATVHGRWMMADVYEDVPVAEYHRENSFIDGFDAAIALDLPIKFAEWQEQFRAEETARINGMDYGEERKKEYINLVGRFTNKKELYQYWIDNVFKPE